MRFLYTSCICFSLFLQCDLVSVIFIWMRHRKNPQYGDRQLFPCGRHRPTLYDLYVTITKTQCASESERSERIENKTLLDHIQIVDMFLLQFRIIGKFSYNKKWASTHQPNCAIRCDLALFCAFCLD